LMPGMDPVVNVNAHPEVGGAGVWGGLRARVGPWFCALHGLQGPCDECRCASPAPVREVAAQVRGGRAEHAAVGQGGPRIILPGSCQCLARLGSMAACSSLASLTASQPRPVSATATAAAGSLQAPEEPPLWLQALARPAQAPPPLPCSSPLGERLSEAGPCCCM